MVKLLKTQFSVFGPSDLPMSEIVVRYLSISRLGILSNLIKLPFEQVVDVKPFIRHFFFIQKEGSESLNESSLSHEIDENAFRIAEGKIASLSHSDLIHYLKSVACFIKKQKNDEDLVHIIPLFSLLYRVCIKLPATYYQCSVVRLDIFRTILFNHASLFSTLLLFVSESMIEHGEANIALISGISLTRWVPEQSDISLIQDWILNEQYQSVPSRLAQTVIANMNWGTISANAPHYKEISVSGNSTGDKQLEGTSFGRRISNIEKPCIPLGIHQKIANIIIRQILELAKPENSNIVSKTQDSLGLNKARVEHISFMYFQLGRILINPLFRKKKSGPDPEFGTSELIEAHSNPLLGPAVLHSSNPACSYMLVMLLDSSETEITSELKN